MRVRWEVMVRNNGIKIVASQTEKRQLESVIIMN